MCHANEKKAMGDGALLRLGEAVKKCAKEIRKKIPCSPCQV